MAERTFTHTRPKRPWHLWAVGLLGLLWYGSGALTIMMAQSGRLPGMQPGEVAYYAAQPGWFMIATDIGLLSALAAAIALLMYRRMAVRLYALSLGMILLTNAYDFLAGTSLALTSRGTLIMTLVVVVVAVLQLAYAHVMIRREPELLPEAPIS